jgi:hypothetical protein
MHLGGAGMLVLFFDVMRRDAASEWLEYQVVGGGMEGSVCFAEKSCCAAVNRESRNWSADVTWDCEHYMENSTGALNLRLRIGHGYNERGDSDREDARQIVLRFRELLQ